MKVGISIALATVALTGCGDPLFTAQDRGDAILTVAGKALTTAANDIPASDLEVGVLFMRQIWDWSFLGEHLLELQFIKGTLTGKFPAAFHVQLDPPEATFPHTQVSLYESWDEQLGLATFFLDSPAPEGMRIGHLVIGPRAELAALPERVMTSKAISPNRMTFGTTLKRLLPNTTVTSYQVLYSQGVPPDTRMYSFAKFDSDHIPHDGIPVREGYMLIDTTNFTHAVKWSECARSKRPEALASAQYQSCVAENMVPESECANRAIRAIAEPSCGPEATPDVKKLKVLSPADQLSVRLGEDDVKDGIWVLHSTEVNQGI